MHTDMHINAHTQRGTYRGQQSGATIWAPTGTDTVSPPCPAPTRSTGRMHPAPLGVTHTPVIARTPRAAPPCPHSPPRSSARARSRSGQALRTERPRQRAAPAQHIPSSRARRLCWHHPGGSPARGEGGGRGDTPREGGREGGREGRRSGGSCSLLSVVPRPAPCAHPAASSVAVRWASTCSPGADRERSKGKRRARRLGTRWDSAQSPLPPRAGAPHLRSVRKLLMRHTRATSPHP